MLTAEVESAPFFDFEKTFLHFELETFVAKELKFVVLLLLLLLSRALKCILLLIHDASYDVYVMTVDVV